MERHPNSKFSKINQTANIAQNSSSLPKRVTCPAYTAYYATADFLAMITVFGRSVCDAQSATFRLLLHTFDDSRTLRQHAQIAGQLDNSNDGICERKRMILTARSSCWFPSLHIAYCCNYHDYYQRVSAIFTTSSASFTPGIIRKISARATRSYIPYCRQEWKICRL